MDGELLALVERLRVAALGQGGATKLKPGEELYTPRGGGFDMFPASPGGDAIFGSDLGEGAGLSMDLKKDIEAAVQWLVQAQEEKSNACRKMRDLQVCPAAHSLSFLPFSLQGHSYLMCEHSPSPVTCDM